MSTRTLGFAAAALAVAVVATLTARSSAGPEKIAFPARFQDGVLYTVADRHDVKQYRELYASPAAIEAARAGKPLPSGTVLTLVQYKARVDAQGNPVKDAKGRFVKGDLIAYAVMEKRTGWGAEYADDIRNGEWEYAMFAADGAFNDKANYKACLQCHKPHDAQDFVISYPAMAGQTVAANPAPAPAGSIGVSIGGFAFGPAGITVAPGRTVTWANTDDSPHQIMVAGTSLKTGLLLKGQNGSLTFKDEGIWSYGCALHPSMKGTVQVSR
jgi:plastocyanin